MRIVSVCPSNTDLMAHLGKLEWVVGRDSWSDWPEGEVESIPVIGSVLNIRVQDVEALEPDLILASRNVPGMERVVPKLEQTGLPMVVYDPESWEDVLDNLRDLGARLGIARTAEEVIGRAVAEVARLRGAVAGRPPLELLVEWWPHPVIVPFRETYVNHVLDWVGMRNPFAEVPGRSGKVTLDAVAEKNPDLYAISWCGTPYADYDLASISMRYAGRPLTFLDRPDRMIKLWEGVIGHPSLRLLDGARQLLALRERLES